MQTVVECMCAVSGHLNSQQLLVNSVTQQVGIHLSLPHNIQWATTCQCWSRLCMVEQVCVWASL